MIKRKLSNNIELKGKVGDQYLTKTSKKIGYYFCGIKLFEHDLFEDMDISPNYKDKDKEDENNKKVGFKT